MTKKTAVEHTKKAILNNNNTTTLHTLGCERTQDFKLHSCIMLRHLINQRWCFRSEPWLLLAAGTTLTIRWVFSGTRSWVVGCRPAAHRILRCRTQILWPVLQKCKNSQKQWQRTGWKYSFVEANLFSFSVLSVTSWGLFNQWWGGLAVKHFVTLFFKKCTTQIHLFLK